MMKNINNYQNNSFNDCNHHHNHQIPIKWDLLITSIAIRFPFTLDHAQ